MTEESLDPTRERLLGVGLVVALHVVFTALTAVLAYTLPLDDFHPMDLMGPWLLYLGVIQGAYVIPAALTVALMQRWQMLIGIGAAAAVSAVATPVAMALG